MAEQLQVKSSQGCGLKGWDGMGAWSQQCCASQAALAELTTLPPTTTQAPVAHRGSRDLPIPSSTVNDRTTNVKVAGKRKG